MVADDAEDSSFDVNFPSWWCMSAFKTSVLQIMVLMCIRACIEESHRSKFDQICEMGRVHRQLNCFSSFTLSLFTIMWHQNLKLGKIQMLYGISSKMYVYMLSYCCVAEDDKDERESNDGKSRIPSMLMLLFLSLILTERRKQRKNNHRHTWKFRNNNICNIFTSLRALRRVVEWVFYDFCWLFLCPRRDLNLK